MGNNVIALAESYLPILDEIYKKASLTSVLDLTPTKVKFKGGNKVELFDISMDGLGNYSRNDGFADGAVTGSWEDYTLQRDRGRSFQVDSMDDEETLGQAFGNLASEFLRTQVAPEVDAYRFATYATKAGIVIPATDISVGTTDCVSMVDEAEQKLADEEVPEEDRLLFVSENFYRGIKSGITRVLANENGVQRNIETFDNMPVIRVPKGRFNSAITLADGKTSGQESGGYSVPAGSYKINFMIVSKSAVMQVAKHVKPRIFTPDQNQKADAWKFDYRIYHDAFVFANKLKGVAVNLASTANA